ncbi:MAG: hypothetical protein IPG04_21150 [Polyangiaceae bacterium]|nr:hypothetical protein [Polyangiaceae bacterium]
MDDDTRAILSRRAQLVSAALACLAGCSEGNSDRAKPTVCLSFGLVCPAGSEPRVGAPRGILTSRPDTSKECVPAGSPSSVSAARAAASASARAAAEASAAAEPTTSASAEPSTPKR